MWLIRLSVCIGIILVWLVAVSIAVELVDRHAGNY